MNYAIAFAAGFFVDLFYCVWVASVGLHKPARAAVASVAVGGCGLLGLMQAIDSDLAAAAYLGGLGGGTYLGVLLDMWRKDDA